MPGSTVFGGDRQAPLTRPWVGCVAAAWFLLAPWAPAGEAGAPKPPAGPSAPPERAVATAPGSLVSAPAGEFPTAPGSLVSAPAGEFATAPGSLVGAPAGAPAMVLPDGPEIVRLDSIRTWSGELLYDRINGAAPQYLEYGFRELSSQAIRFRGRAYVLDRYRMADPAAAFGIWSTRRPEAARRLGPFAYSSYTGYQGLAAVGACFYEIQAEEVSDSTAFDMEALLARAVSQMPAPAGSQPAIDSLLACLPVDGRLERSERLARGKVSLGVALGPGARGSFLRLIDAVEEALGTGAAEWLIAAYHPGSAGAAGRTVAALLCRPESPDVLLDAVGRRNLVPAEAESLAPGAGWLVVDPAGGCWLATVRGKDLLLACSSASADTLRAWATAATASP